MADVLDQSEVDALLSAIDSGDVEEVEQESLLFSRHRRDTHNVEIRPYDFKRPERVSKDQMMALQTLHEAFARSFGAALSGFLRTIVEVKVANCEQMTYSEFISGLPNPTSFNLIEADTLEGQMCLEISPLVIYPIIDRLLGGNSHDLFIPQRPMTLIESRIIGSVTSRALESMAEAWAGVRELKLDITATESNPQLVQIVPPNEVVVVVGFEIKLSNRAGTMNLCIPYNVIEPVMEELAAQSWFSVARAGADGELERGLAKGVARTPVSVSVLLGQTRISMEDLWSMRPGDVLVADKRAHEPAVLCVEGEKKFLTEIGQFKGKRAVRVVRPVTPRDRV